jgi:hypothetical protein
MMDLQDDISTGSNIGSDENSSAKTHHLSIYLNDHLAGATTLVNLLDSLLQTKPYDLQLVGFFVALRADVVADLTTLETIMNKMHVDKRRHITAMAWLIEKVTRLNLGWDKNGSLYLLEALELVEAGLEGKRELWRSLAVTSGRLTALEGIDFDHLIQRAQDQHDRVEAVREQTAKAALTSN